MPYSVELISTLPRNAALFDKFKFSLATRSQVGVVSSFTSVAYQNVYVYTLPQLSATGTKPMERVDRRAFQIRGGETRFPLWPPMCKVIFLTFF